MAEKGLTLSFDELVEGYREFIQFYEDDSGDPKYRKALASMIEDQKRSLSIDWNHLYNFNEKMREIAEDVIIHPTLHIDAASRALKDLVNELLGDLIREDKFRIYSEGDFHVRFYNIPTKTSLRDVTKFSIGRLVEIEGIITRVSDIYDKLEKAIYICSNVDCGEVVTVEVIGGKLRPPERCPICGAPMKFNHELSEFVRWRSIRIQERPEDLPPGMMPEHIDGILLDDLVDEAKPGDRVKVVGIIRIKPARREERRSEGPIYRRYLEIVHIEVPNRIYEKLEITPEDEEDIWKLASREDLEDLIVRSIAPSIYGWDEVKRAIAYALFGGTSKVLADGTKVRGEINILMVGDPGVAKCITEDSLLISNKGVVRIGQLANGHRCLPLEDGVLIRLSDVKILSLGREGAIKWYDTVAIAKRRYSGYVYRIETGRGFSIDVTETHPFLVLDRSGRLTFKSAKELSEGDYVATIGTYEADAAEVSPYVRILSYLYGLLLPSDFVGGKFRLRLRSEAIRDITQIAHRLRNIINVQFSVSPNELEVNIRPKGKASCEILRLLGSPIPERQIPHWILYGSRDTAFFFIKGIMSHAEEIGEKLCLPALPERISLEISLIAARIGLVPILSKEGDSWRISFNKCKEGILGLETIENTLVPNIKGLLINILKNLGIAPENVNLAINSIEAPESEGHSLPRAEVVRFLNMIRCELSDGSSDRLRDPIMNLLVASSPYIVWDRVTSISRMRRDLWVYDLEVPESHNFVASGMIIHNSQLLKYTAQISPRGLYTTGKGSTAAGLTAAVVRDSATGGWTLEAGALVLADRGTACIDEFDKMNEDDRRSIHEAMEQQTISIAKAGIVATLNARTTIIAAANPKKGRYDEYVSVVDNINLPPTVLSRFDLVFIMRDEPSPEKDALVADHVLSTRMGINPEAKPPIDPSLLKKYIAYARQNINPVLTEEAANRIKQFYVEMRKASVREVSEIPEMSFETIAITPRQLEALIRLSEARARMHLRKEVTKEDAERAIMLMKMMLEKVGYDVATGTIDITGLMTGASFPEYKRREIVLKAIKDMARESEDNTVDRDIVIRTLAEKLNLVGKEFVLEKIISDLLKEGTIYQPEPGKLKPIG